MPYRSPVLYRERCLVFTEDDEAVFSALLRERFPGIRFHDLGVPGIPRRKGIEHCVGEGVRIRLPPGLWPPEAHEPFETDQQVDNRKRFGLRILRSRYTRQGFPKNAAFRPPTIAEGRLVAPYLRNDKAHLRFVDQVLRVVPKMATNRLSTGYPRKGIIITDGEEGSDLWLGHYAQLWCSRSLDRALDFNFRPASAWTFPYDPEEAARTVGPEKEDATLWFNDAEQIRLRNQPRGYSAAPVPWRLPASFG